MVLSRTICARGARPPVAGAGLRGGARAECPARALSVISAAALAALALPAAALPTRAVVRTNEPAPGAPADSTFSHLYWPSINAAGTLAFQADIQGPNVGLNAAGAWAGSSSAGLSKVYRQGEQAVDAPAGTTFQRSPGMQPTMNAAGNMVIGLKTSPTSTDGIWSTASGTLARVARTTDPADAFGPGQTYSALNNPPVLADNGSAAFVATARATNLSTLTGILAGSSGASLTLVARQNAPAPVSPAGPNYSALYAPAINPSGQLLFRATLTGTGTTSSNNAAVFFGAPGSIVKAVRAAESAPGTLGTFKTFDGLGVNAQGQLSFYATLQGDGVVAGGNDTGIWSGTPGSLELVARKAAIAPDTDGLTFDTIWPNRLALGGNGRVAFQSFLAGSGTSAANNTALFTGSSAASVRVIARAGDRAPGTPDGVLFAGNSQAIIPYINQSGQVAFFAALTGTGVDTTNDKALFAYDPLDGLRLVAREGDSIQVGPGVTKTLRGLSAPTLAFATGSQDGRPTILNDAGVLAFSAWYGPSPYFQEAEALFIADINAPTPGDFDRNGLVDVADLRILYAHLGQPGTFADGDADRDGTVTFADYQLLERNFGLAHPFNTPAGAAPAGAAPATVPEPAAAGLIGLGALVPLARRRRRD